MPRADEVCKSELFQYRRSRVTHCLCGHNRLYQRLGNTRYPSPKWKLNLGERADLNERLYRAIRPSPEAVIRYRDSPVVVILDNECPYTGGPIEKLKPSTQLGRTTPVGN